MPGALTVAGMVTVFQTATDDAYRGRVYGSIMALRSGAMLAGIGLAGALPAHIGIVPVIAIQGVGYLSAGVLVLVLLSGRTGSSDAARSPAASTYRTP